MPAAAMYSLITKKENAHENQIYSCAWATIQDGQSKKDYIVTGGLDGLMKVWHFENNKFNLLHELKGHTMPIVSIAVSGDGHTIASSSMDSNLVIWELLSGIKVHKIDTHDTEVFKIAFSPEGTRVLSGDHNGLLNIYDIVNNAVDYVLDTRSCFPLCVAWSKDGKYIACGTVDGKEICIFNLIHSKLIHSIEAHTQLIRSVAFTHDSRTLISASYDGTVKLFNVESGNQKGCMNFECWAVGACVSPNDTLLAIACADGSVTFAGLSDLQVLKTFNNHTDTVWDIKFNAEGNKLVSVSKDQSINIYECPIISKTGKK